jgi:5-bromo-4-chloroindolyl phosphate hydrolysis protein
MKEILSIILMIIIVSLICGLALLSVGKLLAFLISMEPKCIESEMAYYWESWDGTKKYLGTDLADAKEMANGKPMALDDRCIKYNK